MQCGVSSEDGRLGSEIEECLDQRRLGGKIKSERVKNGRKQREKERVNSNTGRRKL